MAVSLQKGQKVNLSKDNPGLSKIMIGLGWDTNKYDGGHDFDLDASAFLTGSDGKAKSPQDFIFYHNLNHSSGAVVHQGDNLTGEGEGDDEEILVDLTKIPADIMAVAITVTIHEADIRKQNFGQVSNAYIRIINEANNTELLRYDLGEDFSIETALVAAEVYRDGNEWKFNAVGQGFAGGLGALCANYGVSVTA